MFLYQVLTILLVFSLPLLPQQFANDQIVFLIFAFSVILLPIFFRELLTDIKKGFVPTFCFIAFLVALTISTIFSIDKEQSIMQLRLFLAFFVVLVSIRAIFQSLVSKEFLSISFLLMTSILSFISLYNTLVRQHVEKADINFYGVFFGHNHLSALLVFAIPLCLYFVFAHWKNNKTLPLILAILFLLVISLVFTFSIGAMISLALSFLITLLLFGKTISSGKFTIKKHLFIAFILISFLGVSSLYFFSETKGIKTIKLWKDPFSHVSDRFIFWQRAYDNFLQKPIIGSGPDTFKIVNNQTRPFSVYAHNYFIQTLSDMGMLGFFTFSALIGFIISNGYNVLKSQLSKRNRLIYLSIFIGILSSALFASIDFDWHLPTVFLFFWIFASISTSYAK